MAGQTVVVSVLADTKQFSKAFKQLSDTSGLSKLGAGVKALGKAVAVGAGAVAAGVGTLIATGIKSAADLEQSIGAVDAVFKGNSGEIHKWSKSAAMDLGLTRDEYNNAAVGIATSLKNAGTPVDKLNGQTNDMIGLAADLAATFGGPTTESVNALGAAFRGEMEPLRKYGISLSAAEIEARALKDTGKSSVKELTKQDKALATQALAFEQSADAQGAFSRESNTLSGQQQRLRAQFENIKAEIGQRFLPIMTKVTGWVSDRMGPAFQSISNWINNTGIPAFKAMATWFGDNILPKLKEVGGYIQTTVIPALQSMGTWITGTLVPALAAFGSWIVKNKDWLTALGVGIAAIVLSIKAYNTAMAAWKTIQAAGIALQTAWNAVLAANPIGLVVLALVGLVAGLTYFFTKTETGKAIWDKVWNGIKTVVEAVATWFTDTLIPWFQSAWDTITAAVSAVGTFFSTIWNGIKTTLSTVWGWIATAVSTYFNAYKTVITTVWNTVKTVVTTVWNGIKSFLTGIWNGLTSLITTVFNGYKTIITGVFNTVKGFVTTVWNGIKSTISGVLGGISSAISGALGTIKSVWSGAWDTVKNTLTGAWDSIKSGVTTGVSKAVSTISGLPGRALSALGDIGTKLLGAGKSIIDGFINGIKQGFQKVKDTLGNLTDLLPDWKGPAKRDKTILRNAGRLVMGGFNDGLSKEMGTVEKNLNGFTKDLSKTDMGSLTTGKGRLDIEASLTKGAASGNVYQITVQALAPSAEIGRQVVTAIKDFERLNGVRA